MKMRKNAGLTPLRQEGIARSVLAGKVSRPDAASVFRASVEAAALRVGHFGGPAPPAAPTVPRHCTGHVGPCRSMSPSGRPLRRCLAGERISVAIGVRSPKYAGLAWLQGLGAGGVCVTPRA